MPDLTTAQLQRLTAARWQGEQALFTAAVAMLTERPALPDDLAGLVARARYMVGNPSAWDGYDEGASGVIRSLSDAIEALAAEVEALTNNGETILGLLHKETAHNAKVRAEARLSASEPQCAAVRRLAWDPSINNRPWHSAKAPWGWYYAQWDDETEAWFASLEMGEIEGPIILLPSDVPTIDDAKAAAQADYEARILSAITMRTEAEVRAEAWAAAIEAAAARIDEMVKSVWDYELSHAAPVVRAMITDDASAAPDRIKADETDGNGGRQ